MQKLLMFRCTRNASYCRDLSARQGYYIEAKIASDAIKIMGEKFPEEKDIGFTAKCWS